MTTAPVTIEQAAAILGVSASTIRRRIRAGALRVEETHRPQGVVWLVHLPAGTAAAAEAATVDTAPVTTAATTPTPPGEAIAAMIQATLTPIIAPLVAELAASRQTIERQAATIAELSEDRGRLTAALEAATAAPAPSHSPVQGRWRRWWPLLAVVVVLAIGAVAVLLLRLDGLVGRP